MKKWFSDGAFRTIIRNSIYLGSGNVASALLGLLALSCAGRGMSPEMFGVLIVIQSYTKAVSDFAKFQTWQFIVQFGMPALVSKNLKRFCDVIAFSFGLDIVSGALAMLAGMILLPWLSGVIGLDAENFKLALLYCTLIPFMASSTPTGILRTLDRFDLIAIQQAVKPLLIAIGSMISYFCQLGFTGFIVTWFVSSLFTSLLFWWFSARELRRNHFHRTLRPGFFAPARRVSGAWNFVWMTNLSHSIWSARNSCSTVLVGILLGPVAAGLFKIAMTVFDATGTPAGLLSKSFYPEIMRLDPRSKRPWILGLRSALLAGGIGILVTLLVVIVGKPLISLVFGVKYLQAYDLIQVMLCAVVISMMGFPQESLLLMAGKQRACLVIQTCASASYMVLLATLPHFFGIIGAAFAYFGGQCFDVLFTLIPTLWTFFHRHSLSVNTQVETNKNEQ